MCDCWYLAEYKVAGNIHKVYLRWHGIQYCVSVLGAKFWGERIGLSFALTKGVENNMFFKYAMFFHPTFASNPANALFVSSCTLNKTIEYFSRYLCVKPVFYPTTSFKKPLNIGPSMPSRVTLLMCKISDGYRMREHNLLIRQRFLFLRYDLFGGNKSPLALRHKLQFWFWSTRWRLRWIEIWISSIGFFS